MQQLYLHLRVSSRHDFAHHPMHPMNNPTLLLSIYAVQHTSTIAYHLVSLSARFTAHDTSIRHSSSPQPHLLNPMLYRCGTLQTYLAKHLRVNRVLDLLPGPKAKHALVV